MSAAGRQGVSSSEQSASRATTRGSSEARAEQEPEFQVVSEPAMSSTVPLPPAGAYQTFLAFWAAMHGAAAPAQAPPVSEPAVPEMRVEVPPVYP